MYSYFVTYSGEAVIFIPDLLKIPNIHHYTNLDYVFQDIIEEIKSNSLVYQTAVKIANSRINIPENLKDYLINGKPLSEKIKSYFLTLEQLGLLFDGVKLYGYLNTDYTTFWKDIYKIMRFPEGEKYISGKLYFYYEDNMMFQMEFLPRKRGINLFTHKMNEEYITVNPEEFEKSIDEEKENYHPDDMDQETLEGIRDAVILYLTEHQYMKLSADELSRLPWKAGCFD